MKMSIGVTIISVLFVVGVANSEYCGRTTMVWIAGDCSPYQIYNYLPNPSEGDIASGVLDLKMCQAKVCGNGRVDPGTYCGKGTCNAFGYDCDGGCVEGNAKENFKKITGINNAVTA